MLPSDDEDSQEPGKPVKAKRKKNKRKWGKHNLQTKKDDSDSSQSLSKSEEKDAHKEKKDADFLSDWGFMADMNLAAEDPQVLKYVKMEEQRRKYKNALPDEVLWKRSGDNAALNSTWSVRETEERIPLQPPPKSVSNIDV